MHPHDPAREAVRAAAERTWTDVVANYERGRDAWIAARLEDYDEHARIEEELSTMLCTTDCPTGPHAHPVPFDDELAALAKRLLS